MGAVAAEGIVIRKIGVWREGDEIALLRTCNLYVPTADKRGKVSPTVLDVISNKLQEGAAGGLRWVCPPPAPCRRRCSRRLHHSPPLPEKPTTRGFNGAGGTAERGQVRVSLVWRKVESKWPYQCFPQHHCRRHPSLPPSGTSTRESSPGGWD